VREKNRGAEGNLPDFSHYARLTEKNFHVNFPKLLFFKIFCLEFHAITFMVEKL
jgi:hypothetical protein